MAFFTQVLIDGILTGGVYALMALAVVLIVKSSSIFNFAHGSLVALTGFLLWQMMAEWHMNLLTAIPLQIVFIFVLAYLIQRLILNPLTGQSLMSAVMATIALGEVFNGVIVLFWPGPGRTLPKILPDALVKVGSVVISVESIINFVVCGLCFFIFLLFFQKTKTGLAMRGTSEDHTLAQSEGIQVNWIFIISWFVAILVALVGGALVGAQYGVSFITLHALGMKSLAVVILGGMESILGAMTGGLMIGVLEMLGAGYLDPYVGGGFSEVAPFIILLIVLIFKPYGLFGYERIERV
ncbi:branched-chain amino acid ABC transporter permease [Thermodesulfobacteriota bacterium]